MKVKSSYGVEIKKQNICIRKTLDVYRAAVAYLVPVYDSVYPELAGIPDKNRCFNKAEHMVHTTKANTARFDFDSLFPKMPSYLRRSAIRSALGSVFSFHSRLALWKRGEARPHGGTACDACLLPGCDVPGDRSDRRKRGRCGVLKAVRRA